MPEPQPLFPDEAPVVKVIATGVSLVVGLANDRQITFQTGFEGDEPDDVVNARLDRIMRLADRQKARYQIEEVEEELVKHQETLANFLEDLERREIQHTHDQAAKRVEIEHMAELREQAKADFQAQIDGTILKIQQAREEQCASGLEAYRASGRQGSYVPSGATKRNLELIDKQIDQAKEHRDQALKDFDKDYDDKVATAEAEYAKAEAERDQWVANLNVSIRRYEEAIEARQAKLAKCRALAEG
jgi:hypothetical protein